nr:MAG TPA: hypothetical protein [Caudoviricetes sp.]
MTEEFISRTEAPKDFESCNAENQNWTPQRVKTLLLRQPAADVAPVEAIVQMNKDDSEEGLLK